MRTVQKTPTPQPKNPNILLAHLSTILNVALFPPTAWPKDTQADGKDMGKSEGI